MKRTHQIFQKLLGVPLKAAPLAIAFACLLAGSGDLFAQQDFHDWSWSNSGSLWTFGNTSPAGTIVGSSSRFAAAPTNVSLPAITQTTITVGFNVGGTIGDSIDFSFSSGYAWGIGGQMVIGNIHNYYEYTLSAW